MKTIEQMIAETEGFECQYWVLVKNWLGANVEAVEELCDFVARALSDGRPTFYVEMPKGCFLVRAANRTSAKVYTHRMFGSENGPYRVSPALQSDIDWVEKHGGAVHESEYDEVAA
jgi:hypothetical protein